MPFVAAEMRWLMTGSAVTYVTRGCTSRATLGHSKHSWDRSGSMLLETGALSHVSSAMRSRKSPGRRSEELNVLLR